MARPIISGLSYFPLDTDLFSDRKIRRLVRKLSNKGFSVYMFLLCEIYRDKGYYLNWGSEMAFDVSDSLLSFGISEEFVEEVIAYCFEVNLFNRFLKEKYGILTSLGIQKRYLSAKKNAIIEEKYDIENLVIDQITLVNDVKTIVNDSITPVNGAITNEKEALSTQRKRNNSIIDKKREEKKAKSISIFKQNLSVICEDSNLIDEYVSHRKKVKAMDSERAWKMFIKEVSNSQFSINEILEKCLAHGWKGFEADWIKKDEPRKQNNCPSGGLPHIIRDKSLSRRPPRTNK